MALHLGQGFARAGAWARAHGSGRRLAVAAEMFLKGYWNEQLAELDDDGEEWLQMKVGDYYQHSPITVFDVGANHGQWARQCLSHCHSASLHCFELVPATFAKLKVALHDVLGVVLNECGLSDRDAKVNVSFFPDSDSGSSIEPLPWKLASVPVVCQTIRGDSYCRQHGIKSLHFLKIDTEGHEMNVLRGFGEMLARKRIHVIQFEYGHTWLPPRCQLVDAYKMLVPHGYVIGRLFPQGVVFSDYSMFRDETFRMGNYIAVHGSHSDLIRACQFK